MEFDAGESFSKLYKTGPEFKLKLLEAISTQYIRKDVPSWAEDLQFLTICPSEETSQESSPWLHRCQFSDTPDSSVRECFLPEALAKAYPRNQSIATRHKDAADSCRCASYRAFDSETRPSNNHSGRKTLRLTSHGELPGCTHYLAVSYCWEQPQSDSGSYDIVLSNGERRESKVPASVLDRVIAYAASQAIKLIWIDQECIDQNDEEQVELGVDAMDIVYRQSQQVVAVLNSTITEQAHIDAFGMAEKYFIEKEETGTIEFIESELRSIMQVSALTSKDRWFSRVWTLHESLMTDSEKLVHFLVTCESSLKRSNWLGDLSGQLVVH